METAGFHGEFEDVELVRCGSFWMSAFSVAFGFKNL